MTISMKIKNNITREVIALIAAAVLLSTLTGCVERKLTINTNPSNALVILNDEEIGFSPVTVEFNWYGDYNVRIEKQGYETLVTHRDLKRPLHDVFPLDFFAEVLWPGNIVNEYDWSFDLAQYQAPERDELIKQAQQMKINAMQKLNQTQSLENTDQ